MKKWTEEEKGAENHQKDNYARENPRNKKKPERAKAKNVTKAGMKGNGGRAHVHRGMVKNRMHLVWATDAGRVFGPCCGAGSAGEG